MKMPSFTEKVSVFARNCASFVKNNPFRRELFEVKERPSYNEPFMPRGAYLTQPEDYKTVISWVKRTPECIGILNAIVTDIVSDGQLFVPVQNLSSGKQKVSKAELFWSSNHGKELVKAALFDWLILGNFAVWKGALGASEFKEAFSLANPPAHVEFKEFDVKSVIDEDSMRTRRIVHVPWSTMHIDLNEESTEIVRFRQIVSGKDEKFFSPVEIIHGKFMSLDGRAYGFTPMFADLSVISTLGLLKDQNGYFFENGGVPDWMFVLPNEMAGSPNHKELIEQLQKYKNIKRKHGNMVFCGEVEPKELNRFDKDMEFRQLAIYYTGVLALSFNMPVGRVASIIGGDVKPTAGSTDLGDAGYWRTISGAQDYVEDLFNSQLWSPEFGVQFKFKRGYRADEIKEAQRDAQALEVANTLLQMGAVHDEYIKDKLMIDDRYWTGKKLVPLQKNAGGFGDSDFPKDKQSFDGDAATQKANRKRAETTAVKEFKEGDGMKKFTGFEIVDFADFRILFDHWVKNSETRRVLYSEDGDKIIMKIYTPDTNFLCVVDRAEFSPVDKMEIMSRSMKVK